MSRTISYLIIASVLFANLAESVSACMMIPRDYTGRISQNRHQAILFHQGNRQEMILRVNYKITGKSMPDQFA